MHQLIGGTQGPVRGCTVPGQIVVLRDSVKMDVTCYSASEPEK